MTRAERIEKELKTMRRNRENSEKQENTGFEEGKQQNFENIGKNKDLRIPDKKTRKAIRDGTVYEEFDINNLWEKATSTHRRGDYQSAIKLYEKYLTIKPKSAEALTNKASALCELRLYKEAYDAVRISYDLVPGFPMTLCVLGIIAKDYLHNYDLALDWFEKGLKVCEIVPNDNFKAILTVNKNNTLKLMGK